MKSKLQQWGLGLALMGGLSFVLPLVGIQFKVFNLFGAHQAAAGLAAVVLGAALFLVVQSRKRSETPGQPAPGPIAKHAPATGGADRSAATPLPAAPACPKCGAAAQAGDRFCMACGSPLAPPVPAASAAVPPAADPSPTSPPLAAAAAAPRRRRQTGCLVVLLVLLLVAAGVGWYFFGPAGTYQPPARSEPAVPSHMAGTLTEFPVDTAAGTPLQPTDVVTQDFLSEKQAGSTAPVVQAPPESFPPGLTVDAIPRVARSMTTATYQSDPPSAPVYVQVMQAGPQIAAAEAFAQSVAQNSGGALQGVRVQSPQGQRYDGYSVRSATILVYFLANRNSGNIIILYAPTPEAFPSVQRLVRNVGNGRGLRDYPQLDDTYAALPGAPPPGYVLAGVHGFTGAQLLAAIGQAQAADARGNAAFGRILDAVRVLIPIRGTLAGYRDTQGREKNVLIGGYGSPRKARSAWRVIQWTFGLAMQKNNGAGFEALSSTDHDAQVMLFRKGSYIGLARVPAGAGARELADLARSIQL